MAKRGRPSKLNPEMQERICALLRGGAYRQDACALAGIHVSNFGEWMKKGETEAKGKHKDFRAAVLEAEAFARMTPSACLANASKSDPKWAAAWLKMRWPKQYSEYRIQNDTDSTEPIEIHIHGLPDKDEG